MRYRAKEIEELVWEQEASGETVPDFCRSRGLQEKTFYVWRQRVKRSNQKFARVQTGVTVKIELADSIKLQVPLESLRSVLEELRR